MVESITPERAKELAAGAYGEVSAKYFSRYVVPFFFGQADESGQIVLKNGSAFFVRTSETVFGITADHVITGCLEASGGDTISCGLFPVNYSTRPADLVEFDNLEDRIIDRNERRDIATFRVTDDELTKLGVTVASKWPPVPPEIGKGIGLCGFPSDQRARETISDVAMRSGIREVVLSFMVFPVMAVATSISELQITYVFDWKTTVQTQGFRITPTDLDLGGMSGGPCFTKVETPAGIEHWAPVGVIFEGRMNPDMGDGRIFAARIDDCMSATGNISG